MRIVTVLEIPSGAGGFTTSNWQKDAHDPFNKKNLEF